MGKLKLLDLSYSNVGDHICIPLMESLISDHSTGDDDNKILLEYLYLWQCNITDIGCDAIAKLLKCNNTIKELDIRYNPRITCKGYVELSNSMERNRTLKYLAYDYEDN